MPGTSRPAASNWVTLSKSIATISPLGTSVEKAGSSDRGSAVK
jgi:hypothetical protein